MKKQLFFMILILPILVSACGHAQQVDEGDRVVRIERKASQQAWLGVSTQDMTRRLARSMDVKTEKGALVNDVIDDSPAEAAGVKRKDIIIEFNGKTIEGAGDLARAVRKEEPGTEVSVVVLRDQERKTLRATLEKNPREARAFSFSIPPMPPHRYMHRGEGLGLSLLQLDDQLGAYFEAPDGKGVLVRSVKPDSRAGKAGFKAGDVIISVGKKPVERVDDVRRALRKYDEGEKVECEVIRKGKRMTLSVEVPEVGDFHGYYFHYSPHSDLIDDFDIDIDDGSWMEMDELRLERDRLDRDIDNLRRNLDDLKRTIRDHVGKLRDGLRSTLEEIIGS